MTDQRNSTFPAFDGASAAEQRIAERTRTLVIGPYLQKSGQRAATGQGPAPAAGQGADNTREFSARLAEAVGLAAAIDLDVIASEIVTLKMPRPATFLGKGKVEDFRQRIEDEEIGLVLMDCALSPVQQRNLEKELNTKVVDRTGLILEIFGRRAQTREGAMQVELAHLNYQKSRLVRSWTHLERQRGGFGFLGGPGETQIEADRRLIQDRMKRIERDLEGVSRTRSLHRASRDKVPFPTVALVGYTNAGKSTLFNQLTRADVMAKDMLFATLDSTKRSISLPHGMKIILSDTVGFISDLPTMLVAAFRATLEDVIEANVILHVRDVAHEDADAQSADVKKILTDLGVDPAKDDRVLEVWNKSDLLDEGRREQLLGLSTREVEGGSRPVLVSALTGEGVDRLLAEIEARLSRGHARYHLTLAVEDGAGLAWIYENCEVLERQNSEEGAVAITLRVPPERELQLQRRFSLSAEDALRP